SLGCLPFRHRNNTVFWCQVEIAREETAGQAVTLALLRRLPDRTSGSWAVTSSPTEDARTAVFQALAEDLPFAVALTDRQGRVVWVNTVFAQQLQPGPAVLGQPLRSLFTTPSAAMLEQLIRKPDLAETRQH